MILGLAIVAVLIGASLLYFFYKEVKLRVLDDIDIKGSDRKTRITE